MTEANCGGRSGGATSFLYDLLQLRYLGITAPTKQCARRTVNLVALFVRQGLIVAGQFLRHIFIAPSTGFANLIVDEYKPSSGKPGRGGHFQRRARSTAYVGLVEKVTMSSWKRFNVFVPGHWIKRQDP